jgi:hypothetical protein
MASKSRFIGRMEKRLPIAIVVRLAPLQDQSANGTEVAYTDNVSAHGARVVAHRPWQTGEMIQVTSMQDENTLRGKVVYCQKLPDDRYLIGLNFQNGGVSWSRYTTYSKD